MSRHGKSLLSEVSAATSLLLGTPVILVEREGSEALAERVLARCETEGLARDKVRIVVSRADGAVTTRMWRLDVEDTIMGSIQRSTDAFKSSMRKEGT